MINQQLFDTIKQQLQQGVNRDEIKSSLIANGWQEQDIDETFYSIENPISQSQSVPLSPAQTISSLPGATVIFGQAWAIYKQRLGTFLGVMIIPTLILAIFSVIFVGISGGYLFFQKFTTINIGLLVILGILFFVIFLISQIWGQIALLYAIKDNQEKIGAREAYRRGWNKILSYWWIFLLTTFIIIGGFFLFIIPGIIFAIWFSFPLFILITEDLKGMNAVLKSKEYVKGYWGGVFWRFLFIALIYFIFCLIIAVASSFVQNLIFGDVKISFIEDIISFVLNLFWTPLLMVYIFLIYSNLKSIKGEIAFVPVKKEKITFIVIGILGILVTLIATTLVIFSLDSIKVKARDARRQIDIRQIQMGLEIFYDEQNKYPFSLNELSLKYLPSAPVDPLTKQPYQYQLQADGEDYQVCAQLESTKTQKCITSQD